MSYTLRPAIITEAKPLVGLYAESGRGKTNSALLLAKGFAGDMSKVVMIETEAGRGEVYADDPVVGGFQVVSMRDNFSPVEYGKALSAAESANPRVVIIDSASHEWEGAGGVLDMAAKNQADGKKGVIVWQQPKILHQREFMLRLLSTPIPLVIVCMRAKYPMEEVNINGKKEWKRSPDLSPKQSEDILFEMFVHGWIDKAHAFHGTKYTIPAMREIFRDGEPVSVATGERLAAWTGGRKSPTPADEEKVEKLCAALVAAGMSLGYFLTRNEKKSLDDVPASKLGAALKWIGDPANKEPAPIANRQTNDEFRAEMEKAP